MNSKNIALLLVEDRDKVASIVESTLLVEGPEFGYQFEVARARSLEEGITHIDSHLPGEYCRVAVLDQELGPERFGGAILLDRLGQIPEGERPITIGHSSDRFGISPGGREVDVDLTKGRMDFLVRTIHEQLQQRNAA